LVDLLALADEVCRNKKLKSKGGVNSDPWWTFIPIENFILPFLHILIGFFHNSFDRFRAIISNKIEYISPKEADLRKSIVALEEKIG
jgi:hypothetical protein